MKEWKESTTSVYKGFFDVQPDVLEWVPDAPGCPNGLINIYELKVGEGKGETEPAEAYQLVKAKRAIELIFIHGGKEPPCFRLYFLPWMYGTPENKKTKFKNYKNFPGHGVKTWGVLSKKDPNGYNITELGRETFQKRTGLSAEVITLTLDLLRTGEANLVRKILNHIHRHSLGYSTTSRQALARTGAALQHARQQGKTPSQNKKEFAAMQSAMNRIVARQNIPEGMNNLAYYIRSRPKGIANAKASNIVARAIRRIAARPQSKWIASINGENLGPKQMGFSRNNNYLSNAEGPGIRNNKEMQRIQAGLERKNVLNRLTLRDLEAMSFRGKPQPSLENNVNKMLNQVFAPGGNEPRRLGVLYKQFLQQHAIPPDRRGALNQLVSGGINKKGLPANASALLKRIVSTTK
jgi:hypothetical protein